MSDAEVYTSDEDSDVGEDTGVAIPDDAELEITDELSKSAQRRIKKKKAGEEDDEALVSTVVYLGHIPFGFFEEQMRKFFTQFGTVGKLRLARSKKTANSKGYAFIEFLNRDVAEIVADTMDGYMMYGRILKCNVIPPAKVHEELFKGAGKKFKRIPRRKLAADRHNKPKSKEQTIKVQKKNLAVETRKRKSLAKKGIEYSFPGYSGADTNNPKPAKKKKTTAVAESTPATPKSTKKKKKTKAADGAQTPAAVAVKTPKSAKKSGKTVKKTPGKKLE